MARPFPVLAFVARILVAMQLQRPCLTALGLPLDTQSQATPRSVGGLFLERADPQDELVKLNEQALDIRKKTDSLALECKLAQAKDKETLDDLHRELRAVSGQLAANVALESSAKHAADREQAQSAKLKGQLIHIDSMCQAQKKHLNASVAILRDKSKAEALRSLSGQCVVAAFPAIRTSFLQGCSEDVATPMLEAGEALEREAHDFATPFAKQAFQDALRRASAGSAFPALLASGKAWPSKSKAKSNMRAKTANACKMTKGAVNCDRLSAELGSLVKRLEEQKDAAVTNQRKQVEDCMSKEKQINDRIRASASQHARSSAELLRVTGLKASLAASRASIVQRVERTERDAKKFEATCKSGAKEFEGELEDILEKRQIVANKVAGERVAIQDCEVSKWRFSKCSKPCKKYDNETAGYMEASRSVVQVAGLEGTSCPQLSTKLSCNDKPCPTNCVVAEWAKWSTCSKACGGGTTKRTRKVLTQTKDGGKKCPILEMRKSCHVGRCSDVCKLKEWTSWSACSRRCKFSKASASGQQQRTRDVIGNPMKTGGGSPCPPAGDETRIQARACNEEICPKDMTCDASQDVLFLLDGSGVAGDEFKRQLALASAVVKDSSQKVRFGVVAYGKEVKILSRITANRTQLASISAYAPPAGGSRDSAKGEVLGRTLFSDPGIGGGPKVVVLLLGGPVAGLVNAKKAAEELRSAGIRVIVGLVDDGSQFARQQACSLASAPCSANVEAARSWEQMTQESLRFLAAICHE